MPCLALPGFLITPILLTKMGTPTKVSTRAIPWVVAIGIAARVAHYLSNRSLWLDEAMVALNIDQRSFTGLAGSLDFNQAAPLGFLWLEKLAVTLSGVSEFSLRMWPLVASILALLLFVGIARRLLRSRSALFVIGLMSLSTSLVYYAAEVKQYAFDVLLTTAVLFYALSEGEDGEPRWVALGVVGAVGVWLSHPLIFVLPGAALYAWLRPTAPSLAAGARSLDAGTRSARIRPLVMMGLVWGASFAAAYFLTARDASRSPLMARFWLEGFMPLPPRNLDDLGWFSVAASGWVRNTFDFSETVSPLRTLAIWIGGGFAAFGIFGGWRRDPLRFALVGSPVVLALAASAATLYPFKGRLILFLVPSTLVFIGWGFEQAADITARIKRDGTRRALGFAGPAAAIALIGCSVIVLGGWLKSPVREEIRPVLEHVAARARPGDVIYLHSGARHAFLFYERTCPRCVAAGARVIPGRFLSDREDEIEKDLAALPTTGRIWMLFAHSWWGYSDLERMRLTESVGANAQSSEVFQSPGAWAYLFDLGGP